MDARGGPALTRRMAKSKLVSRETKQGRIAIAFCPGQTRGVMVEVSCARFALVLTAYTA